jgi:hypothetical protein
MYNGTPILPYCCWFWVLSAVVLVCRSLQAARGFEGLDRIPAVRCRSQGPCVILFPSQK